MTVTKIVVSKGKSVARDDIWVKVNYELTNESRFENVKDLNRAKDIMSKIIDGWLLDKTKKTPPPTQEKKSQLKNGIWSNYDKKPCKEGEEGWTFTDKVQKELLTHLTWQWKQIEDMEYKLGGNGKIVNRRPIPK